MAGEQTPSRPNFFILLGLNPDDPWDEKKFEQTLEAKRSEWARKSNSVGNIMLEARRNLARVGEIRQVMTDPAERDVEAAAARKERQATHSSRLDLFERQLAIATRKGFLEKAELDKFITDFKDVLSEKEIRGRIKVEVRAAETQTTKGQQLDPLIFKTIHERLQKLQKKDLYDFLSMPRNTSCQELSRVATEVYTDMQRRQPKTPEITMNSELAGQAKSVFKDEETRQKYNESLRLSKLNDLLAEFEKIVNVSGTLYASQVDLFLQRAVKEAGYSQKEASARLREHAKARRWSLEVPTSDTSTETQQCGYCDEVNKKENKFCSSCNRELQVTCPDCGQVARSNEAGCVKCGFPVGNRYWVDDLLADCDHFLSQQDLTTADTQLRHAEGAWKPKKPDARLRQIQEKRTEIQQRMQTRQQDVEQLKALLNRRCYFTAREYLSQVHLKTMPDRESYLRTVNGEITRAQELFHRARLRNATVEQRIELCVQALRICADYKEAGDMLSATPPAPPGNLQAGTGGATISLRWDASPSPYVSYKIVRKLYAQPVSLKDGCVLDTIAGRMYDDTQPETGVPMFYAVFAAFADFDEVVSSDAARLSHPVMLMGEVTDIAMHVDSQFVELSWQVPQHTQNVLVIRKENAPPASQNDGISLNLLNMDRVIDRDVQNDHRYFYTIYCQFKDYNGRLITSGGVTRNAAPEKPPQPISSLDITNLKVAQGYEIRLHWKPPEKGRAVILKSKQTPPLKEGEAVPEARLKNSGQLLEGHADALVDPWMQPGVAYYTPVVLFQGMAYVGAPRRFAVVDDVSDLRYQNLGNAIRLNWTWPPHCQEVVVVYAYHSWPQEQETSINTYKVTRTEYEHRGYFDIRSTQNRDHYIVVSAVIRQGNDQIIGSGARIQARLVSKIVITYQIKTPRSLFGPKKRSLQVSTRAAGTLPTLLLVSKQGRLPLRKEEGEILMRLPGPFSIEDDVEYELPGTVFPPRTFSKLYLEDDTLYEMVTIHHPSEDKLRLA